MALLVADLVRILQRFPQQLQAIISGPDCGGYDWTWKDDVDVKITDNGKVSVCGCGEDVSDA